MFEVEITKVAEKDLRDLAKTDKKLLAEVLKKLELLKSGNFDALDIKPIKRKGKNKILEIKIKFPSSYRIFYFEVVKKEMLYIISGVRKKVNKLPSKFFDKLDKRINNLLDK